MLLVDLFKVHAVQLVLKVPAGILVPKVHVANLVRMEKMEKQVETVLQRNAHFMQEVIANSEMTVG